MSLTTLFAEKLARYHLLSDDTSIAVAYSGGVDSHVLLHLCVSLRKKFPKITIKALHVNHGISENALRWQMHCQSVCKQLKVPFLVTTLAVPTIPRVSLEETARKLRYQALAEMMDTDDILALGQHQQDQVETLLLQLKRGAGPKGLAAMAEWGAQQVPDATQQYRFFRPLIDIPKAMVLDYAQAQQLCWQDDESNTDSRFDRNFLRNDILPALTERWPGFSSAVTRSARLCAEQQVLLDEQSDILFQSMPETQVPYISRYLHGLSIAQTLGRGSAEQVNALTRFPLLTLNVEWLLSHSEQWQRQLLRRWVEHWRNELQKLSVVNCAGLPELGERSVVAATLPLPNETVLLRVQRELLNTRVSHSALIKHGRWQFRRYRQNLYLSPAMLEANSWATNLLDSLDGATSESAEHALPFGLGHVSMQIAEAEQTSYAISAELNEQGVVVCLPKALLPRLSVNLGGLTSRFHAKDAAHSKPLKQWFKDYWFVPPWLRSRIPLIMLEQQVLAVANCYVANSAVLENIDATCEATLQDNNREWISLTVRWQPIAAAQSNS